MAFVQPHKIDGGESNDDNKHDKEYEIGDQTTTVERLLSGCVKMGTNDVTSRLANEQTGRCGLFLGFTGGVLGGPGVD